MEKQLLEEIIAALTEMAQYMEACDEDLAWEVSAKHKIDVRVFAMPQRLRDARSMAQTLLSNL